MEIKNAADQDRAYKAEFPELPMQWKNYGYEITEKLGEGISGSVYKLVKNKGEADEEISALKMISWTLNKKMVYREYGNDWVKARRDFTQFFNDKVAHEVSRLESFAGAENIVQIKGSCLEKMPEENFWKLYIQMEYLEDFTEYLGKNYMEKNETMDAEEVIRFGIEICSALEICHEKGIIHRDIKPDNLMVSKEGQFKLGDFGIAREPISGTMTVAGTPDYMAPEVKETTIYDKTADIYSLGLVLYYLSNDFRLPFADVADPEERINRRMKKDAVLPEPENAFADMRKLILKACAYDPKDRYQSAGEMKRALENIQKHPYGLCPKCGKVLVKKPGQYGAFVACTGYRKGNPDSCDYRMNLKKLMEQLKDTGLTLGQPKVLDYLKDHDGASQKEIAAGCLIEAGSLTSILNRMEEKGLIERKMLNGNRRTFHIFMTESGKKNQKLVEEAFKKIEKTALNGISEEEQKLFMDIFCRIYRNLADMK